MAKAANKPEAAESKGQKHIVISEFRDASDFSVAYKVGSDVSHFDVERLERLVANGHVEKK